jgi:thiosulfate/3-mercaptopyruvate sulfurtransferase
MTINDTGTRGIISPETLHNLLESQKRERPLKLLDATCASPGSTENPEEQFRRERIDGACFFNIAEIRDLNAPLPYMLPSPETFSNAMSNLGINSEDLIVIYGQSGTIVGPARAWWTFRVFGHNRVAILDGGLPAWKGAGYKTKTRPPAPIARTAYHAAPKNPAMVLTLEQMRDISDRGNIPILDARSRERFAGTIPEPRPGLRCGHIPGSLNIPADALVDAKTGKFLSPEALRGIFLKSGLPCESLESARIATTCGSGITACALALALFYLGNNNVAVYDGSWSEWGQEITGTKINKTEKTPDQKQTI